MLEKSSLTHVSSCCHFSCFGTLVLRTGFVTANVVVLIWVYFFSHRSNFFETTEKLCQFSRNVWKSRLVISSFITVMGQMTEMSQRKKKPGCWVSILLCKLSQLSIILLFAAQWSRKVILPIFKQTGPARLVYI